MSSDLLSKIIDYESGMMDTKEELLGFFQELVDTGLAWSLQGSYGRTAQALLEEGLIESPKGELT